MAVIRGLDNLKQKYPNPVLTIGNFDGVHLGHRALFDLVKKRASEIKGTSMVMTFEPHPIRVLTNQDGPPLITLHDQKIELIQAAGIEVIICLEFTPQLAKVEPEDFVKGILVDRLGVKEIIIGYDYTFGYKGRGNREMLLELGRKFAFAVHVVTAQPGPDGRIVSSTLIRDLVTSGRVSEAPSMLGRYYRLTGQVIRGLDRGGKLLGFPTANLRLVDELIPKTGVYAVKVTWQGQVYNGVANIGYNPTFGGVGLSVEVHCLDFQDSIYGHDIKVDFVARIRDEMKFSGADELAAQITRDCQHARRLLSEAET